MIVAYMLIRAKHGKLKIVSSKLKEYPEIEEIHEVYGRFDIIAKIFVEDEISLKQFIQNKIFIVEGIHDTETLLVYDNLS
ncbi:MAG: Lrp/AsnC ligand binding domain-containing protein [Nanoarchaeota archaeon]|nr:Lrp/AsnC ligand binding domain-containing protein [Nanoarchaeota archaeon]MBU1030504.1 Lrp/AsnC ligand binding domain-containing protein [Nanoarchaeota archaeon]MBU1850484.1 Lrp/AsnC ligand binding domain-containing protein [Nanoarchaeota archaeon]